MQSLIHFSRSVIFSYRIDLCASVTVVTCQQMSELSLLLLTESSSLSLSWIHLTVSLQRSFNAF